MTENYHLLDNKVIIITCAGRGIGQAMATVYAENGAIVYANDVREGSVEEWCGPVKWRRRSVKIRRWCR